MAQFVEIKVEQGNMPNGPKSKKHYINKDFITDVIVTEFDKQTRVSYYQAIRDADGDPVEIITVHANLNEAFTEVNRVMNYSWGGG